MVLLLAGSALGVPSATFRCDLPECVEGTPVYFDLTFRPDGADFAKTEKWRPETVIYEDIDITMDGKVLASHGGAVNLSEGDDTEQVRMSALLPAGSGELELCFNKSVFGEIYALNVGTASGSSGGVVHTRGMYLFTWSDYKKPGNRSCETFARIGITPRASIDCLRDGECGSTERCEDYDCVAIVCGKECAQISNHACSEPECCSSSECPAGEVCSGGGCTPLECGEGQIQEAHSCRDVVCSPLEQRHGKSCALDLIRVSLIMAAIFGAALFLLLGRKSGRGAGLHREKRWYR